MTVAARTISTQVNTFFKEREILYSPKVLRSTAHVKVSSIRRLQRVRNHTSIVRRARVFRQETWKLLFFLKAHTWIEDTVPKICSQVSEPKEKIKLEDLAPCGLEHSWEKVARLTFDCMMYWLFNCEANGKYAQTMLLEWWQKIQAKGVSKTIAAECCWSAKTATSDGSSIIFITSPSAFISRRESCAQSGENWWREGE